LREPEKVYYVLYYRRTAMAPLSVRLKPKTEAQLDAYCERTGLTRTQVVEESLTRTFATDRPTFAEIAKEVGLFGSSEGPGDLSMNVSKYVKQKLRRKHGIRRAR
jgi:predicted transcriptional regulator